MTTPENNKPTGTAQPSSGTPVETQTRPVRYWRRRSRTGLLITLAGFLIFLVGARPGMLGLDRSPIIGFIQIAVFLVGLGIMCVGGFISLTALWGNRPIGIAADIGLRMVATGYVIAVFAGMADIFGFGSHSLPKLPFFGPWQARGVEAGEAFIALGFLMMLPFHKRQKRATRLGSNDSENAS